MLKSMRKNMKAVMWVLLVTFVLWGGSSALFSGSKTADYAGIAFGKKVGLKEYEQNLSAVGNQAKLIYGEKFNQIKQYLNLEQDVWDRIILLREAAKNSVSASDNEVLETICRMPLFLDTKGRFDPDIYKRVVEYFLRVPAREFEDGLKGSIIITKLREKVTKDVAVSDKELKEKYAARNEKINVDYAAINADDFKAQATLALAEQDISHYYQAHLEEFKMPLRVNIEYIPFEYSQYQKGIDITTEEIDKYYENHKKDYAKELKETAAKNIPEDKTIAEIKERVRKTLLDKKAKDLADEASSDASYELAQQQQPDLTATAKKFNRQVKETGFFAQDEPISGIGLSYEVASEAFKLEPGQISPPIKTQAGRYIIKFKAKKQPYIPLLEEIYQKVKDMAVLEEAKKLSAIKASGLLADIKQKMAKGLVFKQACAELALDIKSTGPFTKEGYIPQIGKSEEFANAAFAQQPGSLTGIAKIPQGAAIIFVTERTPIDEEKFKKEKDKFMETALEEKKAAYFEDYFKRLKEKADVKTTISPRPKQGTQAQQHAPASMPLDDF